MCRVNGFFVKLCVWTSLILITHLSLSIETQAGSLQTILSFPSQAYPLPGFDGVALTEGGEKLAIVTSTYGNNIALRVHVPATSPTFTNIPLPAFYAYAYSTQYLGVKSSGQRVAILLDSFDITTQWPNHIKRPSLAIVDLSQANPQPVILNFPNWTEFSRGAFGFLQDGTLIVGLFNRQLGYNQIWKIGPGATSLPAPFLLQQPGLTGGIKNVRAFDGSSYLGIETGSRFAILKTSELVPGGQPMRLMSERLIGYYFPEQLALALSPDNGLLALGFRNKIRLYQIQNDVFTLVAQNALREGRNRAYHLFSSVAFTGDSSALLAQTVSRGGLLNNSGSDQFLRQYKTLSYNVASARATGVMLPAASPRIYQGAIQADGTRPQLLTTSFGTFPSSLFGYMATWGNFGGGFQPLYLLRSLTGAVEQEVGIPGPVLQTDQKGNRLVILYSGSYVGYPQPSIQVMQLNP